MPEFDIKPQNLIPILKKHPEVGPRLNFGLGGNTFLDHIIGMVEEAIASSPSDGVLKSCYYTLQCKYPAYFSSTGPREKFESKNRAYKACNGF